MGPRFPDRRRGDDKTPHVGELHVRHPGTPSEDALKMLASWAATTHDEQPLGDTEQTAAH
jgi:hypothetical protein